MQSECAFTKEFNSAIPFSVHCIKVCKLNFVLVVKSFSCVKVGKIDVVNSVAAFTGFQDFYRFR